MQALALLLPLFLAAVQDEAAPPEPPAAPAQAPAGDGDDAGDDESDSGTARDERRRSRLPLVSTLPLQERVAQPLNLLQVQRREALISFSAASARAAIADLDAELSDPVRRATALMALGASRARGVVVRLEAWALGGVSLERQAALLALGELGSEGIPVLRQMTADPDPKVAEAAILSLMRIGSPVLREEVAEIARDESHSASEAAWRVLTFTTRIGAPAPEAARLHSELRWDAARRYGLVSGKSWRQLRIEELESNEDFLQAVVLRTAVDQSLTGIEDHLLDLLDAGGAAVVRAAVRKLPLTLGRRFEEGTWAPANLEEWTAVMDGIEASGSPREAYVLAREAQKISQLRLRATSAMLAMGDETAPKAFESVLFAGDRETRRLLCRSLGRSRDPRWVKELSKVRREPDVSLQMAALVAQMRMGYRPAEEVVRSIVLDGTPEEAEALTLELLEVAGDPRVPPLLDAVYPRLVGATRIRVGAQLLAGGRLTPRAELRQIIEQGTAGEAGPAIVRALALSGGQDDRDLLASLFPVDGGGPIAFELNVELARVLIRSNHAVGMAILSRALWSPPWNQSILAAGILARSRGVAALHEALDAPPTPVTQNDLRRVGFALGEWGGPEALESLARRRPAGDPALQGAYLGAMSVRGQ